MFCLPFRTTSKTQQAAQNRARKYPATAIEISDCLPHQLARNAGGTAHHASSLHCSPSAKLTKTSQKRSRHFARKKKNSTKVVPVPMLKLGKPYVKCHVETEGVRRVILSIPVGLSALDWNAMALLLTWPSISQHQLGIRILYVHPFPNSRHSLSPKGIHYDQNNFREC